jgi:MSHA biogenesis protein MshM
MYLEHFGIKEYPFTLTPNVHFYCNLPSYQAGLNVLLFSLASGEGFIKIVGEVGSGKTLLCRKLLNTLSNEYVTAYIPNPDLTPSGLRKSIARELGVEAPFNVDQARLLGLLGEKLLKLREEGKKVVLIVDEAQALSDESLEAIRLLTNLETESEKLIQIVLFGQPELDERLRKNKFRQLNQRIIFSHRLGPLTRKDFDDYICHRLSISGYTRGSIFNKKASNMLYYASRGIPRVVNILSHKAMLVAYGKNEKRVNHKALLKAIADSKDIVRPQNCSWTRWFEIGVLITLIVTLFGVLYYEYLQYFTK